MVGTDERLDSRNVYYSPARVRYWLEHWRELLELAAPTAPAIRYDKIGTMPDGMRLSDPTRWTDVAADIEREWAHLHGPWSAEFLVVEWLMRGEDLVSFARGLRIQLAVADRALWDASEFIARRLGWEGRSQ